MVQTRGCCLCAYIHAVACWAVVLFVDDRDFPMGAAQQFVTKFTQVARDHGMATSMTQVQLHNTTVTHL
jgi:hypothetical protein